jgi:hypothetical protein
MHVCVCVCAVAQLNAQGAGKGALMFSAPCLHFIPAFSALTTTHALCFSFTDACHEVIATYLILIARLWISLIRGQNRGALAFLLVPFIPTHKAVDLLMEWK